MNPIDRHDESTTCCKEEKVSEPGDLLDESWFFGNLLYRKTRMSRCYSDPSSNYTTEEMLSGKSMEETFSSLEKLPAANGENVPRSSTAGLIRTPSLPEESSSRPKRSHRRNDSAPQKLANNNLSRAPSLPSSIGREEIQDEEESDFSMSRLIRQASLNRTEILPPRHLPKGSSSTPSRHRPRRKSDMESVFLESPEGNGMSRRQHLISKSKLTKSSSDLVFQELLGLRELSIKTESETKDCNKIPSSQEKMERSTTGESWRAQHQNMDNGKKSAEDMKAQIRFWARAVASNVRQEC